MGCTPSTQQYDDDYSVDSSSDGEDTAGSTARSPRSSQRDVRHSRRASGVAREATLDDSALRRPPMIRVDSLTSVRTDGPSP